MAHGYLTPEAVSGEGLGIPYKRLYDAFKKLFRKDLRVVNANVKEVRDLLPGGKDRAQLPPSGQKMLGGAATKLLTGATSSAIVPKKAGIVNTEAKTAIVGKNATDINRKEQKYLGTTDPDTAGGPKTRKGGTFTDFGSTSSAPEAKPLNAENFFAKAQTGVGDSGEYLTKSQRVSDFRKSQEMRTASANTPAISPDSGVDIVAAVNRNTQAIVALSNLTEEQTKSQRSMHNEQQAQSDKLASRALARGEEKALEKGSDRSGFTTPEKFQKLLPGGGGSGGGGGAGGGPGLGIGGKVGAKKVVQAVGKRGAARVGTRLAAKYGGKAAAKAAGKYGGKAAAKLGVKGAAKIGAGAVAKSVGKKIPLVGLGLGAVFAAQRALQGDFVGAGLELASGAASTVPGVGTVGSVGIDAALAARDMGMTPFAKGGIITQPTNALMGESGAEGVFPLEGRRGKNTFEAMGEGILEAQKKGKKEYADLQSAGLKLYFENKGGFKMFGDLFGNIMSGIFGPIIGGLSKSLGNFLGGGLNKLFGLGGDKNLSTVNTGGLADFIGGLESGNDYTKMVGGAKDESVLGKTIDQLNSEKGGQFAMGRYQIQMRTASEVLKNAGIDTSSFKFDKAGQDKIFELLLKRRGIDDFMSGEIDEDQFAKNLSMEWAALPENASGKGYYDGVGTNKSLTSFSSVKGQLSALKASGSPFQASAQTGSGGSQNLAAAAQSLKGMSTADGPDGGQNGCVYAVNKVFSKAGITPPWGSSLYVPDAEKSMIDAGWQQVPYGQQQPGDVFVMKDRKSPPQAHIGVATDNKFILSNSSGKAAMSWSSTAQGYNSYYGGQGALYRMPGQQAVSTAQAGSPGAPPSGAPLTAEQKSQMFQNAGMSALGANGITGATPSPGPISAAPASPNTGTPIMATSAQVASASGVAAAPTVINNYYGSGGGKQSSGVNPNGVSAGIDMNAAGLGAFQELKLRSLA
jgi:hypothetical protein